MSTAENFKQYAADCVRQAEGEQTPEDKNILLNMALAWVRLAQQAQLLRMEPDGETETGPVSAHDDNHDDDDAASEDAPVAEPERKPN